MQNTIIVTLVASLASRLVRASYPFTTADILNEFPPCSQVCISQSFAATNISKTDLYSICNNLAFLDPLDACERRTCSPVALQQIASLSSILCGPAGGIESTVVTTRYPNIPACANNCTSSALLASACDPQNATCACTNPTYLNSYAPCVEAICDTADIDAFNAASLAACGPQGGGPYDPALIVGYLTYAVPGGTAPGVRLLNGSLSSDVPVNTSVASASSPSPSAPAPYTGAGASLGVMAGGVWAGLVGGVVAVVVGVV